MERSPDPYQDFVFFALSQDFAPTKNLLLTTMVLDDNTKSVNERVTVVKKSHSFLISSKHLRNAVFNISFYTNKLLMWSRDCVNNPVPWNLHHVKSRSEICCHHIKREITKGGDVLRFASPIFFVLVFQWQGSPVDIGQKKGLGWKWTISEVLLSAAKLGDNALGVEITQLWPSTTRTSYVMPLTLELIVCLSV